MVDGSFPLGTQGEARRHWVRWSSVCSPTNECGLNIRSLDQIQSALHAKLIWMVMLDQSLWASLMRAKYFDGYHFVVPSTASPLWRAVAAHEQTLRHASRWLVGSGDRSFWMDNWLGRYLRVPNQLMLL